MGDADFDGAEDRVEMDHGLVAFDFGLGKINLEFAKDRREFSTPKILRRNSPIGSAENSVRVQIRESDASPVSTPMLKGLTHFDPQDELPPRERERIQSPQRMMAKGQNMLQRM